MDTVLIQQNPHWRGQQYNELISRTIYERLLNWLDTKEILVLTGIRRCGKSTIFKLLINYLQQENDPKSILYVNLDDPFFTKIYEDATQLQYIVQTAEKLTGYKIEYLFLDEIQNVKNWERYVKSVYDSEVFKKIFITGSNSSLLTGEYAKLLTGRYIQERVYPLSFREILKHHHITSRLERREQKSKVLRLMEDILHYGSLPEIYKKIDNNLKREVLINYLDSILYKDCISNHNIRDIKTFKALTSYLLTNYACQYSYNKLAEIFQTSDSTIKEFIHIIEDSFLISEIKHFSFSLKNQEKNKKKIYVADNGFINVAALQFSPNQGKRFENLVFSELKKLRSDFGHFGFSQGNIFYIKEDHECDFILQTQSSSIAIQVCATLNEANFNRELKGLITAEKKSGINPLKHIIITLDHQTEFQSSAKGTYTIVPFWDFFGKQEEPFLSYIDEKQ